MGGKGLGGVEKRRDEKGRVRLWCHPKQGVLILLSDHGKHYRLVSSTRTTLAEVRQAAIKDKKQTQQLPVMFMETVQMG